MSVSRGAIVVADGDRMLVISGGMYNSLPGEDGVIAIDVIKGPSSLLTISLDDGWVALPARVAWIPKSAISKSVGKVSVQQLTDVNNMLFRILATELAAVPTVVAHPLAAGGPGSVRQLSYS